MRSTLFFLSLFGLLFLTACGKKPPIAVLDAAGHEVGTVEVNGEDGVVLKGEKQIGSIQSGAILGQDGKRVGTVMPRGETILIADGSGNPVGSLEPNHKCFGKASASLGTISGTELVPPGVAAGACYLLFLNR